MIPPIQLTSRQLQTSTPTTCIASVLLHRTLGLYLTGATFFAANIAWAADFAAVTTGLALAILTHVALVTHVTGAAHLRTASARLKQYEEK